MWENGGMKAAETEKLPLGKKVPGEIK